MKGLGWLSSSSSSLLLLLAIRGGGTRGAKERQILPFSKMCAGAVVVATVLAKAVLVRHVAVVAVGRDVPEIC